MLLPAKSPAGDPGALLQASEVLPPASQKLKRHIPPRRLRRLAGLLLVAAVAVVVPDLIVRFSARDLTYSDPAIIPGRSVALVPGTARYTIGGRNNAYFTYRIDAVVRLFEAGKIRYILVSGDNATVYYDEPSEMRRALIERGVPAAIIYSDYAGFRTLDSVVRARAVFGQQRLIIVSQKFQNERAIFLARARDIDLIGFNAADVDGWGLRTQLREYLARGRALFDVLAGTQPKFLGDPVRIGK